MVADAVRCWLLAVSCQQSRRIAGGKGSVSQLGWAGFGPPVACRFWFPFVPLRRRQSKISMPFWEPRSQMDLPARLRRSPRLPKREMFTNCILSPSPESRPSAASGPRSEGPKDTSPTKKGRLLKPKLGVARNSFRAVQIRCPNPAAGGQKTRKLHQRSSAAVQQLQQEKELPGTSGFNLDPLPNADYFRDKMRLPVLETATAGSEIGRSRRRTSISNAETRASASCVLSIPGLPLPPFFDNLSIMGRLGCSDELLIEPLIGEGKETGVISLM